MAVNLGANLNSTLSSSGDVTVPDGTYVLTVVHHPDGSRVGDFAPIDGVDRGLPFAVSRIHPCFNSGQALDCRRVSRDPIWIKTSKNVLSVSTSSAKTRTRVNGEILESTVELSREELETSGVLIEVGRTVLLGIHARPHAEHVADMNLVGISPAFSRAQSICHDIAQRLLPVLLHGEPGAGKARFARSLHELGARAGGPWVELRLSASTSEVELEDAFARACGGSLFLSGIDRANRDVQAALVHRLPTWQASTDSTQQTVRLITATDADLYRLFHDEGFDQALLQLLRTMLLTVPPLRERRVDIPLLLHHFLDLHLRSFDAQHQLVSATGRAPWLGVDVVRELVRYDFPGNVQELSSLALQLAGHCHNLPQAGLPPSFKQLVSGTSTSTSSARAATTNAAPSTQSRKILHAELVQKSLRTHRWNISKTAQALGVAKNTLVTRIRQLPGIRLAGDIQREELADVYLRHDGDINTMVEELEVSPHGLRLRVRELGLR